MTDPVRDRLATTLSATHTIERELGGGGMARVFVATERALGRQVVVKTLPDDAWTASATQRFHREILTAAQLQHANIVPVLGAGDADGVPYFTMPLVEGATLRERLQRGPIPLGEAVGILRDVARALAAAHAKGVVHRDIKPENILLSAGAALVSDFGVAKAISLATQGAGTGANMTALGVAVGTPAYMAPEQIAADPGLDHRADLYAWGVVAYEVLAGARPFAELSGTALIQAQMGTAPPALRAKAPQVPAALADVVMRCLAKEAASRPASAQELLAVLDLPSGETAAAARNATRRWPLTAAAAVLVAAVAWWLAAGRGTAADADVVAVAPFRVAGAAPDVHYLREGIGDVVIPQLRTLPDLRVLGMRVLLERWRRAAGSVDEDLDEETARTVAQQAGAGQLVIGTVVGTRERVTISARLLRARDGRPLATASLEGPADSVLSLGTRLVTTLFTPSGGTQARLRSVLSARPEALAPFLAGERLFRRGRYMEAQRAFLEAYRADTGFALASLRIHTTNGWNTFSPVAGPWLTRTWTHRARLSGEDSLVLVAAAGTDFPRPMDRVARTALLRDLAERGHSAELWYRYGDWLVHDGEATDEPDTWRRALDAFQRAEAADSSYVEALEHQPLIHLVLGDTVAARRALARQAALDSTGDFHQVNKVQLVVAIGSPAERARVLREGMQGPFEYRAWVGGMMATDAGPYLAPDLEAADSLIAKALREQPSSALARTSAREVGWSTGRRQLASANTAGPDDVLGLGEEVLNALLSEADTGVAARSAVRLAQVVRSRPATADDLESLHARFALAAWNLRTGDTAQVERLRRDLEGVAPPANAPWRAQAARTFAQLIGAQLAVARRAPDAAARLHTVDSLLLHAPSLERRAVRALGNHVLSGLYEAHGDAERALHVLARRDGQTAQALFLADRHRRTARLARGLNRRDEEIQALRHFIALRAQADPDLQPEVERARERLAELTGR